MMNNFVSKLKQWNDISYSNEDKQDRTEYERYTDCNYLKYAEMDEALLWGI